MRTLHYLFSFSVNINCSKKVYLNVKKENVIKLHILCQTVFYINSYFLISISAFTAL